MGAKTVIESGEFAPLKPFWCLSGCTAVGKTELALGWAEANDAEIVNCDSLLFYRGMDIGTAKPSEAERARVPHHLIDLVDASEPMDIGRFVEQAIDVIRDIQARGKEVLVTGGSGFYLKAFFQPVVDQVSVSGEVRQRAEALLSQEDGLSKAVCELERLNPEGLGSLDIRNPRRVVKALERCWQSGETLQALREQFEAETNPLVEARKAFTVLERDKEELNARIAQRVNLMVEMGLVEEVRRLRKSGFERNESAARSIGYRETLAFLDGEYDVAEMVERIVVNTRRLAKKQRTWFRHQMPGRAKHLLLSDRCELSLDTLFETPR